MYCPCSWRKNQTSSQDHGFNADALWKFRESLGLIGFPARPWACGKIPSLVAVIRRGQLRPCRYARDMNPKLELLLLSGIALFARAESVPIVQRDGQRFVSARALEERAGIAVKPLAAGRQLAICTADRCATTTNFVKDGAETLVSAEAVAKALGAKPVFNDARNEVRFELSAETAPASDAVRVGQLAPDFRLQRLDGEPVALSDFRGKRVLINSWASW